MSVLPRSALAVLGVGAVITATAGTALGAGSGTHALPGSVPAWAAPSHRVATPAGSTAVKFRVYLSNQGGSAAAQYASAVSTPGNPLYGKFLTPAQYRAKFAPTSAEVSTVASWLRQEGFTVGTIPANRKYVEATGTLSQAAKAFGTSFGEYKVGTRTVRSNTTPLTVPNTLAAVEGVIGLDQSQTLAKHYSSPPPAFVNGRPCSAYWGEKTVKNAPALDGTALPSSPSAWAPCGYAGAQLQGAYGVTPAIGSGNDGSGVTVGVIDAYASSTIESDVEKYSSLHGLPSIKGHFTQVVAPGTYNVPEGPIQDPEGWGGEETLDIEAVHTTAPGADIVYIGAPNNFEDLDAVMNKVVDGHLADIVSNSYGWSTELLPTGYIKPHLDTQIQAAAEGISLFFSSGDSSDETGGVAGAMPTPDWPASSPWVTAVGGTSLGVAATNTRQFELGWATERSNLNTTNTTWDAPTYLYGSGGGTSRLFAQPDYQKGVVPDAIAKTYGGAAMRAVPDVSAVGDPTTGMLVGQTQRFPDGHDAYSEYRIGGTSLSSPLYAGLFALVEQKAGHEYGLANPALYAARSTAYDITKTDLATYPGAVRSDYVNGVDAGNGYRYSVRWFDHDEKLTIHVRPAYDDITGVGSPQGQAWLDAVAAQG